MQGRTSEKNVLGLEGPAVGLLSLRAKKKNAIPKLIPRLGELASRSCVRCVSEQERLVRGQRCVSPGVPGHTDICEKSCVPQRKPHLKKQPSIEAFSVAVQMICPRVQAGTYSLFPRALYHQQQLAPRTSTLVW